MITGITLAFAAGVWLAGTFKPNPMMLYTGAVLLAMIALWRIRAGLRYGMVAIAGLFFVLGMLRLFHAEAESPFAVSRFAGHFVTLSGRVAEMPEWWQVDHRTARVRYIVAAETVEEGGARRQPATGSVVVELYQAKDGARAACGDGIILSGVLRSLHDYNNPGRADSVAALKLQGIAARLSLKPEHIRIFPGEESSLAVTLAKVREKITENMRRAMAPEDAALLNGLLFGGYFGINREIIRDFSASGLVHILSVSGTHIALIAGFAVWLGTRLGLRRELTALAAGGLVVGYALFSGFTPPVVRSVIMGLAALGAVILGRGKDAEQSLAFAVLAMLAYQPGLLYNISFQLSVSATAGLVFLYPKTLKLFSLLPRWLAGPLAVTLAAQLAALPVMAWYFSSFSLGAFLANLLVLPIIEAVVIIGLLGSFSGLFLAAAGNLLLVCSGLLIGLAALLAKWIAALPGSVLYVPPMGLGAAAVYYSLMAWVYGYLPAAVPPPMALFRRRLLPAAAVAALLLVGAFTAAYFPRPVAVHFIDVGQGDAALVTTPHGRAILIDTGGTGGLSGFDMGERVVVPYLKHYGVTRLDYLLLTHGHQDHAGGAAGIAAAIPVRNAVVAKESDSPAVQALKRTLDGKGVVPAGNMAIVLDGVTIEVFRIQEDNDLDQGNALTCVSRVSYGKHSFLVTGDLGAKGEKLLIAAGLKPGSVLKVGHHGARTSTTPELLQVYAPRYAVISAGFNNRFGHPHAEALARLADYGAEVYRTDRNGAVVFRTDGRNLSVEPTLKGP
ncbi:MAG TPA: DNA internalization-related competence protein ComEC/Rec2 [Selenomonadales bacterium]|nr:DNA internalization-related competence protein ComEC/Rec2 [Selenomonadales bacterium]